MREGSREILKTYVIGIIYYSKFFKLSLKIEKK